MKRFATLLAVVACIATVTTGISSAASYHWPSSEAWSFQDAEAKMGVKNHYPYPYSYADCMQKAAQHTYRSYGAWINATDASFNHWLNSAMVEHCMTSYAM